jgi:uncharacterized protein YegP (UPF0339 family)
MNGFGIGLGAERPNALSLGRAHTNSLGGLLDTPPLNALGAGLLAAALTPKEEPRNFPRFELYRDRNFEWRWRYRAGNYETIASGESYKNYEDAVHAINLLRRSANAPLHVERG